MLEHVRHVAGRARRIHGCTDCADEAESKVEERPIEARPGKQPECLSFRDAEREEPVRELVDGLRRLPPGDGGPPAAAPPRQGTGAPPPSTSRRYAGSGCAAATASCHRFAIVRARATAENLLAGTDLARAK